MIYRFYEPRDFSRVAELYKQKGFDYPLPQMDGPGFAFGIVGEQNGRVEIVAFLRLVPEAYLLMNEFLGTPEERWESLEKIHEAVRAIALRRGFNCVYCWIPPELAAPLRKRRTLRERVLAAWNAFREETEESGERPFIRRLLKKGWREDEWRNFVFNLR